MSKRLPITLLPALLAACASSTPQAQKTPTSTAPPSASSAVAEAPPPAAQPTGEGVDEAALDKSVAACDDFYQFACGSWVKNTPIPDDQGRWIRSFSVIRDENETALKGILESDAAGKGTAPYAKQLGDFYASCMDEEGIEKSGLDPIKDELAKIDGQKDPATLTKELAHLHSLGVSAAFRFDSEADRKNSGMMIGEFSQGGLGLPDRDYYFKTDAKSKEIFGKYRAHVAKMLELIGTPLADVEKSADRVLDLETKLASASMTRVERRDPEKTYNKLDLRGLTEKAPAVLWKSYLAELGIPEAKDINVAQPKFASALSALVKSVPMDEWKAYLRYHVVDTFAEALTKPIVDENFAWSQTLSGTKVIPARWKRCTRTIDKLMGEALAIPFVKDHLGEDGKTTVKNMVTGVEAAMKQNLSLLPWMDDATRAKGVEKLSLVTNMIGYPDVWRSYEGLEITRSSFAKNQANATLFEVKRQLGHIGKPTDKSEWHMSPPTVNAYYDGTTNEMVFPAGILQRPFYANGFIDAVKYGAIGLVVGHELTHGFDDKGRKFDGHGNLKDWWSPAVGAEFDKRTACVARQFDDYVAIDEVHVNGKLTLGENIADLGGVKLSYRAWKSMQPNAPKTGSFTAEQQFFLGFAQAWCGSVRPELARVYAQTDPHSPGRFRVNGPLSNSSEFAEAFSCKEGDKMVRPKETRCEVW